MSAASNGGKGPWKPTLLWIQCALLICAVSMLGYCGFVLADSWVFQNREGARLELLLRERQSAKRETPQIVSAVSLENLPPVLSGGLIGRMEIPRLGVAAMVMEGASGATLRRAIGHIPGMAMPGQPGNTGIAGHRDTFFRPLRDIKRNDIITLTTLLGEYRYRVVLISVVAPDDVAVLDRSDNEILTLVTCYPFYFVGPAPMRFIVRAERVT